MGQTTESSMKLRGFCRFSPQVYSHHLMHGSSCLVKPRLVFSVLDALNRSLMQPAKSLTASANNNQSSQQRRLVKLFFECRYRLAGINAKRTRQRSNPGKVRGGLSPLRAVIQGEDGVMSMKGLMKSTVALLTTARDFTRTTLVLVIL